MYEKGPEMCRRVIWFGLTYVAILGMLCGPALAGDLLKPGLI
jgi:hypothetical protein